MEEARIWAVVTTERLGDSSVPCLPANHATGVKGEALVSVLRRQAAAQFLERKRSSAEKDLKQELNGRQLAWIRRESEYNRTRISAAKVAFSPAHLPTAQYR